MSNPTVAIAGSSGLIGSALVSALRAELEGARAEAAISAAASEIA